MTTTRHGRIIVFVCDICDGDLDSGEVEWYDALQVKKDEQWTSRKDGNGEWMDVCPVCKVIK